MTVEPLQARTVRKKMLSNVVTFDKLCRILGVRQTEEFYDDLMRCEPPWWKDATEEELLRAEEEWYAEAWQKYEAAVMGVAEELFDHHALVLEPIKKKHRGYEYVAGYRVEPCPGRTWLDVVTHVRHTINGVGYFHFHTNRELLCSGPYTARKAVLTHLGWIADWPDVYEGTKARSMVERRMR